MSAPPDTLFEATARARAVAEEVVAPLAERTDGGVWPEEGIRALQRELGGLVVPREHGGAGLGLRAVAGVCEAVGTVCASTAICFGMHLVAAAVLSAKATERQAREYLKPIAAGDRCERLVRRVPRALDDFELEPRRDRLERVEILRRQWIARDEHRPDPVGAAAC